MSFERPTEDLWKPTDVKEPVIRPCHWKQHLLFKSFKMKLGNVVVWLNHFMPSACRLLPAMFFSEEEKRFSGSNWQWLLTHPARQPSHPSAAALCHPQSINRPPLHLLQTSSNMHNLPCCLPHFTRSPMRTRPGLLGWVAFHPPSQHSIWPWHWLHAFWPKWMHWVDGSVQQPFLSSQSKPSYRWVAWGWGRVGTERFIRLESLIVKIMLQNPQNLPWSSVDTVLWVKPAFIIQGYKFIKYIIICIIW